MTSLYSLQISSVIAKVTHLQAEFSVLGHLGHLLHHCSMAITLPFLRVSFAAVVWMFLMTVQ